MKTGCKGFTVVLILVLSGCGLRKAQLNELEHEAIATIVQGLSLYESKYPGVQLTNVSHIFSMWDLRKWHRKHPAMYEYYFRKLGKNAGFKNSFYEKYVFVPAGVTNLIGEGMPVLMNAKPFEKNDGRPGRHVVYRLHPGAYSARLVEESEVQAVFQASGIQIPSPLPAEPVPHPAGNPPRRRTDYSIASMTDEIDRLFGGFPITKIVFGAALVSFVFLIYWFGFRQKSPSSSTPSA